MKIAISQPTYLPWMGYLDLIDQVDRFVLLDTVQFEKRSWQQRNRIRVPKGLLVLTVPVAVKGRFGQKIGEVEIESPFFVRKHLRSIDASYRKAAYFNRYFGELSEILETCVEGTRLVDLNIQIIQWMCASIGISTPLIRSSAVDVEGDRSERLLKTCGQLGANEYVSPLGSAEYLLEDIAQFSAAGVDVVFQHFKHPHYVQLFSPFQSHASAIDLLFNEGERSLEIIRSGRRLAFRPEELQFAEKQGAATA